jgi:endonuclease YncB( thermonuclease family)
MKRGLIGLSLFVLGLIQGCDSDIFKPKPKTVLDGLNIPTIEVRVSHVKDGDTFVYEVDNHYSGTVDLGCGIESYRLNQPYGREAKASLEKLLPPGSKVTIHQIGIAPNGNIIGLVLNEEDAFVNAEMIRTGNAFSGSYIIPNTEKICFKRPGSTNYAAAMFMSDATSAGYSVYFKRGKPNFPWQ